MMIHTSFTRDAILAAGRLAGVRFERLDQSGSRTHPRKFDVILSGSGGRANFGADHQAATWDEWGIFLNWIFWSDPNARAAGYYEDRERFRWATGNRFDTLAPAQQHRKHHWRRAADYVQDCACGAVRRWNPPVQATGSGPVRPRFERPTDRLAALNAASPEAAPLDRITRSTIGSRYESGGAYARDLAARGIVEKIDEVLAEHG